MQEQRQRTNLTIRRRNISREERSPNVLFTALTVGAVVLLLAVAFFFAPVRLFGWFRDMFKAFFIISLAQVAVILLLAALLGARLLRCGERQALLRLPDHQHGERALPGDLLPRKRAHALRFPGHLRLRLRLDRRGRRGKHLRAGRSPQVGRTNQKACDNSICRLPRRWDVTGGGGSIGEVSSRENRHPSKRRT